MCVDSRFIKHDIMISYSTKRGIVANDIANLLIENKYTVWIAPNSIPKGIDYIDEIYSAIDNSKIIVFILCEESLDSKWCQNELIYAVKQNKRVLPIQISDIINPYDKMGKILRPLQRSQILQLFPEYANKLSEVLESVRVLLDNNISNIVNPYPQDSYAYFENDDVFVGREDDIKNIHDLLAKNRIMNLCGMGGIGKTSLLKHFFAFYSNCDAYHSIHICKYRNSIEDTIASIPFNGFNDAKFLDSIIDTSITKTKALYQRKMILLQNLSTECLLVIDGADYINEADLLPLTTLGCSVIISSRNKYNFCVSYKLKALNEESLIRMLFAYAKQGHSEKEANYAKKIIQKVGYHTLMIKLIGNYANEMCYTFEELFNDNLLNDLNEFDSDEEKISTLFDYSKLNDEELYMLKILALFPHGITKGELQKIDRTLLKKCASLVKKGIVNEDNGFSLHQIIIESVIKNTSLDTSSLKPFLSRFIDVFRNIGLSNSELITIIKHISDVLKGEDELMVLILHRFGNCICDINYADLFHVDETTYNSQDMNFYNQKNDNNERFEMYDFSNYLNTRAYELALKIDLKDYNLISYILSYIGSTYFNKNDYESALKYQQLALEEIKKGDDIDYSNYIVILNRIGLTAIEVNELEIARESFAEYINIINKQHIINANLSMALFNIGNTYYKEKNYDKAESYYLESISKNTDNPEISFGLSELYMLLADIYLKTNKKELACNYYLKAKRIKNNIIKDKDKLDNFINKYENLYL